MAEPEAVLSRLAEDLRATLGDNLVSLALHGSWVLGDFTPGRSDLDVLVVLATDPTPATFAVVREVHVRLAMEVPEWGDGQVEVEYVSAGAIRDVVRGTGDSHPMIIIGKGEPLREVDASRHYVLNWAAALQANRSIAGARPSAVLPFIDRQLVDHVVLRHVREWPSWVEDMQHVGGQAYTVLTLCRAAEVLSTGRQVSKLAAARTGMSRFPEWSALIDWARAWWYEHGSDRDQSRFVEVRQFVEDVSGRLLGRSDPRTWSRHVNDDPAEPSRKS